MNAVEEAFGADIDYAMLIKLYGEPEGRQCPRTPLQPRRLHWRNEDPD